MKTITLKSFTGACYIDDLQLQPDLSQSIVNHSPDGFAWGYAGSGPSQLALALLLAFTDKKFATNNYQQFKFDVIAKLPQGNCQFPAETVTKWAKEHGYGN